MRRILLLAIVATALAGAVALRWQWNRSLVERHERLRDRVSKYLPPAHEPLHPTPVDVASLREPIRVRIRQSDGEGVPRFFLNGEEVRPGIGAGIPPLEPPADDAPSEMIMAHQGDYGARWQQYIKPKLDALQAEIERARKDRHEAPGQIRADAGVRHAFVIGALDAFLATGMTDVTFYGTSADAESGR